MQPQPPSEDDIAQLIARELNDFIDSGNQVRSVDGWRADCRKRLLANERALPGFIARSAAAMGAKAQGKRLTYCTWSRGSHGISPEYDPGGTDPLPPWPWDAERAKADWEAAGCPKWSSAPAQWVHQELQQAADAADVSEV